MADQIAEPEDILESAHDLLEEIENLSGDLEILLNDLVSSHPEIQTEVNTILETFYKGEVQQAMAQIEKLVGG